MDIILHASNADLLLEDGQAKDAVERDFISGPKLATSTHFLSPSPPAATLWPHHQASHYSLPEEHLYKVIITVYC